ncbi:MAG: hypothetical protein PHE89_06785 [Alphaproteobacteria bacterium]|nr:hypothetical protein [Alphaproteobacteria bacterium]
MTTFATSRRAPVCSKVFYLKKGSSTEVYHVLYEGLKCASVCIYEEVMTEMAGELHVQGKKQHYSYEEIVEKLKALAIECVSKEKFVLSQEESYEDYKIVYYSYHKLGKVITTRGLRVEKYGSGLKGWLIRETHMPQKQQEGAYYIVTNYKEYISLVGRKNEFFPE